MANISIHESTWLERQSFDEAELDFHTHQAKTSRGQKSSYKLFDPHHNNHSHQKPHSQGNNSISGEIAKAREHIRKTLNGVDNSASSDLNNHKIQELEKQVASLTSRLETLEKFCYSSCSPVDKSCNDISNKPTHADDDFELFASEEEDTESDAEKVKQQRIAAYQAKKQKKPALIAKSNVIFDVKPWDDETDMKELEKCVRSVVRDGLLWGASKLVPLAYGIKKLQITSVIEDDKVSTEELEETITAFEDMVQSVDIAAFNKI